MARKTTLSQRVRYFLDNTMLRGTIALIGWLLLLSAALIVVVSAVVAIFGIVPTGDGGGAPGFSSLIGVLTTGVEQQLDELRKGRSLVLERGHTVILGWSPQITDITHELIIANENQRRPCIAILADRDKIEMEDDIRARVGRTGRTRVICRSGDPVDMDALDIVSPHTARSIISSWPRKAMTPTPR